MEDFIQNCKRNKQENLELMRQKMVNRMNIKK